MRLLRCPRCDSLILFETLDCSECGLAVGFHPTSLSMRAADPGGVDLDGRRWVPCSNRSWQCNWLLAEEDSSARCFACRLTRTAPDASDTIALEKLADVDVDVDKRRLLVQLLDLGLPVDPWHEKVGGLAFDLLSSRSSNSRVLIGHANGVITIDLAETLDDYRATLLDDCRALFGDEQASYAEALDRHYRLGAPEGWEATYISEYATMHPWEDFAECFAHYLHITDTLQTAASAGLVLRADAVPGLLNRDVQPRVSYADATITEILDDWHWLSLLFNRINRSMGQDDLYPFDLVDPVIEKLGFVHRVVRTARS